MLTHVSIEVIEIKMRWKSLALIVKMLSQIARLPTGPDVGSPGIVLTRAENVEPGCLRDVVIIAGHLVRIVPRSSCFR